MDWKNALLIISGITLHGAIFGMLMRPLEPSKKARRPRAKNLLDRIKEQAKGNRERSVAGKRGEGAARMGAVLGVGGSDDGGGDHVSFMDGGGV